MQTFRDYAPAYLKAGFTPMPWRIVNQTKKVPAAKGYLEENPPVDAWTNTYRYAEIGIVAHGWLGIDVDASEHGGKEGDTTMRLLTKQLGELPPTISSTARGQDSDSRIYFYSIPKDDRRYRDVGKDVESIRPGHRYAAVYPSRHPSGNTYKWYAADGTKIDGIPSVYEFAPLPDAWIEYLTAKSKDKAYFSGSIPIWKSKLVEGNMSDEVVSKLQETESSFGHTDLIRLLSWLASQGAEGEPGIMEAFEIVRKNFLRDQWDTPENAEEYERALEWAIRNAGAVEEPTPEETLETIQQRYEEMANPVLEVDDRALAQALKLYCQSIAKSFSEPAKLKFRDCVSVLDRVQSEEDAKNWMKAARKAMREVILG